MFGVVRCGEENGAQHTYGATVNTSSVSIENFDFSYTLTWSAFTSSSGTVALLRKRTNEERDIKARQGKALKGKAWQRRVVCWLCVCVKFEGEEKRFRDASYMLR